MRIPKVRVLCVDDHTLVRECVVAVLEREPGLRVAAQARTVKGAVERYCDTRPDVTLVSLRPRGLDCLEAIRSIRRVDPRARIVVYAASETDTVYRALDAGAAGFVVKDAGSADLVRVIRDVHEQDGAFLDGLRTKLDARTAPPPLSAREVEILEMLTHGLRTKAIATSLRISDHTVKVHMKRAYEKLGVHGRAAALAEALRLGFVRIRYVPLSAATPAESRAVSR
jgi:DNA-binding NarL/FixJ family response regulator